LETLDASLPYCDWIVRDAVVQLGRNAFTVSWLEREEKERYVDEVEAYTAH
jgi:hypothetical protein